MTWKHVLRQIDGREYTLDGVHGILEVDYRPNDTRVTHEPSKLGRESAAYEETRKRLRDDWATDLSNSERLPTIAGELLGIKECERLCIQDEREHVS